MVTEDKHWGKRGHKVMVRYLHVPKNGKPKEGYCQFDLTKEQQDLFLAQNHAFIEKMKQRIYDLQVVRLRPGDQLSIAEASSSDAGGKRVPYLTIL